MMFYRKKEGLLIAPTDQWQRELYDMETWRKGDVLWRTSLAAMAYQDFEMLHAVHRCLEDGRRWPYWLDHRNDAKNRWDKWRADRRHRRNPKRYPHTKYRWVTGMTRDPYIMFWTACKWFGWESWIADTPLPTYLYRPQVVAYRNWLLYEREQDRWLYEKGEHMAFTLAEMTGGLPGYAQHLAAWMAHMTDSTMIKVRLLEMAPQWNLLIHALCDGGPDEEAVQRYRAKQGFQWGAGQWMQDDRWWHDGKYLDVGDQYKLDRDVLHFVYYSNFKKPDGR